MSNITNWLMEDDEKNFGAKPIYQMFVTFNDKLTFRHWVESGTCAMNSNMARKTGEKLLEEESPVWFPNKKYRIEVVIRSSGDDPCKWAALSAFLEENESD